MAMTSKDMLRNSNALTGVARQQAEKAEEERRQREIADKAERELEIALAVEMEKTKMAKSKRASSGKKSKR